MPAQGVSAKFGCALRGDTKASAAERAHYLYLAAHGVIYLLFVYGKDEQPTLSRDQKKRLEVVVQSIKREWANQ